MFGGTPFEVLHGHNPNVSHLIFFGSKAWDRIPIDKRKAFQAQSKECILLGYAEDGKAYELMEVANRKCFIERSVQFEEDQLYDAPPSKAQEGINTLPPTFDDDDLLHVSYLDEEDQDQYEPAIEIESREIQDLDLVSIPKQKS